MVTNELIVYIQGELQRGVNQEQIKAALLDTGWQEEDIQQAFNQISTSLEVLPKNNRDISSIEQNDNSAGGLIQRFYLYCVAISQGTKKFRVSLIILGLAFLSSIYTSYTVVTSGLQFINNLDQRVEKAIDEVYPEDLQITLKDGTATTNVTEPYYLTISQGTLEELLNLSQFTSNNRPVSKMRLLTLNTNGKIEDFDRHQSLAMLTRNNVVYYDNGSTKIQSLSSFPNMTITKKYIKDHINEWNKGNRIINISRTALFVSPIVIAIGYWIYYMGKITTGAFILWIINKILFTQIPFRKLIPLMGAFYAIPLLLLAVTGYLQVIKVFQWWFYTAFDVAVLALGYVFLKKYQRER